MSIVTCLWPEVRPLVMDWWHSSFCMITRNSEAAIILPMRHFSFWRRKRNCIRVSMGKLASHNVFCSLLSFLCGTYSNETCSSCSFLCSSPTCCGVAGSCCVGSGIEDEFGNKLNAGCWRMNFKRWCQAVPWLWKVRSSSRRGSLLKSPRTIGFPQMHFHSQLLPLNAINGEHTLNYSWSGSSPLASETLGSSPGLLLQRINFS